MSVDTVNEALTKTRRRIFSEFSPGSFTSEAKNGMATMFDSLRWHLMRNDPDSFDEMIDYYLAKYPDRSDFVLDELFQELGVEDRYGLSAELAAQ